MIKYFTWTNTKRKISSWATDIIIIIFVVALTYQMETVERERAFFENRNRASSELALAQAEVSLKIVRGLGLVEEMRVLLEQDINWGTPHFDRYSEKVVQKNQEIRHIALIRDYVIENIMPVNGNENALKLDYRDIPDQFETVREVILNGQTIITNLVDLVQGGHGIIGRVPFKINNRKGEREWGLIAIVWDVDILFNSLAERMVENGYSFSVRSNNSLAGNNIQIYGSDDVYKYKPISSRLYLEGNEWEFSIAPLGNWEDKTSAIWPIRLSGLLIILFLLSLKIEGRKTRLFMNELKEAQEQAEVANIAKSQFLAAMNHDLRTPLNAIVGFSEVMALQLFGRIKNKKYAEYAHDIHKSSQYLLQLVNDILELSALESGDNILKDESVDIGALALECHDLLYKSASTKDIKCYLEIPDLPPQFRGDNHLLKQVIMNALSNAIKFNVAGGSVTLSYSVHENIHVIEVKDTGIGISKEDLEYIIDPFQKAGNSPYHAYQDGTGLGLTIMKSVAELHGGKLLIKSIVNMGTTVTVTLPSKVV